MNNLQVVVDNKVMIPLGTMRNWADEETNILMDYLEEHSFPGWEESVFLVKMMEVGKEIQQRFKNGKTKEEQYFSLCTCGVCSKKILDEYYLHETMVDCSFYPARAYQRKKDLQEWMELTLASLVAQKFSRISSY